MKLNGKIMDFFLLHLIYIYVYIYIYIYLYKRDHKAVYFNDIENKAFYPIMTLIARISIILQTSSGKPATVK